MLAVVALTFCTCAIGLQLLSLKIAERWRRLYTVDLENADDLADDYILIE